MKKQPITRHTVTTARHGTPKQQLELENQPREATTVDTQDQIKDWKDKSHSLDDPHSSGEQRDASKEYLRNAKGKHLEPKSQSMEMTAENRNALMGTLKGVVSHASVKQLRLGSGNASKER